MKHQSRRPRNAVPLLCGLIVGLLAMFLTLQYATAAGDSSQWSVNSEQLAVISVPAAVSGRPAAVTLFQDTPEPETAPSTDPHAEGLPGEAADCQECHLDVASHWSTSPHAHAFDDEVFQERWMGLGEPGECLVCHTTGFVQSSGEFAAEGIQCAACHGDAPENHPPAPVDIKADTEYCGICHTTTLGEWRLTGHSTAGIGCSACHDPHSQQSLFEEPDDLCLNCHEQDMGDYLEDSHHQKGIGCVDCHALVIPPDPVPVDGIVPTGHTFTITPATCVACHTDALHAGFSLPGYEHGAAAANGGDEAAEGEEAAEGGEAETIAVADTTAAEEATELSPEQRIQALEASLASRNMALLFQGAIVGLVLGGSTAWLVSQNMKRNRTSSDE
jgi:predicted CXXCH cytochrome family protein